MLNRATFQGSPPDLANRICTDDQEKLSKKSSLF
jgi:hypothetical protein